MRTPDLMAITSTSLPGYSIRCRSTAVVQPANPVLGAEGVNIKPVR